MSRSRSTRLTSKYVTGGTSPAQTSWRPPTARERRTRRCPATTCPRTVCTGFTADVRATARCALRSAFAGRTTAVTARWAIQTPITTFRRASRSRCTKPPAITPEPLPRGWLRAALSRSSAKHIPERNCPMSKCPDEPPTITDPDAPEPLTEDNVRDERLADQLLRAQLDLSLRLAASGATRDFIESHKL